MIPLAQLNREWAINELDGDLQTTAQVGYDNSGGGVIVLGTHMRGSETEVAQRAHVVEQILDRVLPTRNKNRPDNDKRHRWLRGRASRAKAALERAAELAEELGDNAPDMDAANLHSWAWECGRSLWNSGHLHQAVMQAALRINSETQAKLGRVDVSERKLFSLTRTTSDLRAVDC